MKQTPAKDRETLALTLKFARLNALLIWAFANVPRHPGYTRGDGSGLRKGATPARSVSTKGTTTRPWSRARPAVAT